MSRSRHRASPKGRRENAVTVTTIKNDGASSATTGGQVEVKVCVIANSVARSARRHYR
ncbi:MAG TPA: hypothetical protein VII84_05060 [Acidimicrobiales bacterium]